MNEINTPEGPVTQRVRTTLPEKLAKGWNGSRCWISYLLWGSRRGVPGLVDFAVGNHFFRAYQRADELKGLGEILAARPPQCALEIGTAQGGTLLFLTRLASPQATIVSVDLRGGRFGGGYNDVRARLYKLFAVRQQRLHLLQGDSHSASVLASVKAVLGSQKLDYLFIDGDHTYEGVKRDFELYVPLVGKGGIMALHDIAEHPSATGCDVFRFWNEIKYRYRHTEIIGDRKQKRWGIGVLYVD